MNLTPRTRTLLTVLVAGLAAAPALLPLSHVAQGVCSVALVMIAALGIVPPQKGP